MFHGSGTYSQSHHGPSGDISNKDNIINTSLYQYKKSYRVNICKEKLPDFQSSLSLTHPLAYFMVYISGLVFKATQ